MPGSINYFRLYLDILKNEKASRKGPSSIQADSRREICNENKHWIFQIICARHKTSVKCARSKIGPGEKNGQTKYQANINESKSAYHAVLAISKCHTVNENTKSSFAEKDAIS